jgi:hypothetical protein
MPARQLYALSTFRRIALPHTPPLRLKDRVAAVKTERDIAQVAFDRAVAEMGPDVRITEEKIAAFAETMRAIVLGEETPFRRAPARAVEEAAHRQQPIW